MSGYTSLARRSWLVPVVLAVAACHTSSRTSAVIGYALVGRFGDALPVAQRNVGNVTKSGGRLIRIAVDTVFGEDLPDVEVKRAQMFAAMPGIVGVVGHASSRGSLAAAPVYNEAGIVQITPYATSRLLKTAGPWTFNVAPDDSVEGAFIGRFVAERLGAHRVTVFYVNDEYGRGLDRLARDSDVALIVLDLNMPVLGGLDVLRQVRQTMNLAGVPVVVLTGSEDQASEVLVMDAGADDYIRKPIDPPRFVSRVKAALRRAATPV